MSRRTRVAIIGVRGYPSYYGGFETAVRRLAPHLADMDLEIDVYCRPGAIREDDPHQDARINQIFTRGLEKRSLSTLSYGLTASLHAVFRRRPDVALVMNVANGFFLPMLRVARIPTVVNVDGMEWERAKWGRLARLMFRSGAKLTAKWGDKLVADALEIKRRWSELFGVDSVYIPYGGDVSEPLELEPGLEHRRFVLIVARFVPENSVGEFFSAVEQLPDNVPVVIVGSTGYGGELDERAARLAAVRPAVQWLGHVSDDTRLHSLWQHAGVYFHGHSVGGTNPALVQAMALGAPVIARDTPYNREVLGDAGRYVAPTASAIAEEISRLLADTEGQRRMSDAAVARTLDGFTWEQVNASYASALLSLVRTRRP